MLARPPAGAACRAGWCLCQFRLGGDDHGRGRDARREHDGARPWPCSAAAPAPPTASAAVPPPLASHVAIGIGTTAVAAARSVSRAPVDELAHGARRDAELARHLVLAAPLHGDPQQRLALTLRQSRQARERLAHHRPPLERVGRRVRRMQRLLELRVVVARRPQLVQRVVADDAVQHARRSRTSSPALQRAPRGQERLLKRVPRLARPAGTRRAARSSEPR